MGRKYYLCLLSLLLMFLLVGCRSSSRRVISDLEYYGYRVEHIEDEEEKADILFEDYVVNLYRVYSSEDEYLADLYEMYSKDTLIEALESEGYQEGDFPCSGNMMLILRSTETLDLMIVFHGNDPSNLPAN